jgi:DHA2 family multidrug resistance protein
MATQLVLPAALNRIERKAINPWAVAITVTIATFMELLDTSIANVSLPHIAGGLAVSFDESTWVLTSYLVANAVVLPMSAWLSRVFGRKNYYMMCVALFTASSFLCGIAPTLGVLVACRVLQGIAGGGLAPVEQAILVDTFPASKRAAAFALYSMAIVTAPAIGPPLGGWITDTFSWRWVFFINVPIGLVSLALSSRLVSDPRAFRQEVDAARRGGKLKIDSLGIVLIALGFGCLEVVLDRGQIEDWFDSRHITVLFTIACVALLVALVWEWRHSDPVVELTLLRERNFALAVGFYFLFGFALFGSTTIIPEILQNLYGYTATDAGLVLGPGAAVITFLAPVVAQLVQRGKVSPRALIAFSFAVVGGSMWYYGSFTPATDYFHYAFARAIQGFGYAFLFVPVSVVAYSFLPANKNNKASSLTNLARNWGGSFGVTFVTTMHERRADFHQNLLVSHVTEGTPQVGQTLQTLTSYFVQQGDSAADALHRAQGQLYRIVGDQASLLGFMDCFRFLVLVSLIGIPLAFLIRPFKVGQPGGGH